ncbi:MAG TPA: HEAT repeat domain-containing protein [Candidatus Polarisedimenticolaceae bacterium]
MLSALAGFGAGCGKDADRALREVEALRERGDSASMERLAALCGDASPDVRAFALAALADGARERAAERIQRALADPDVTVRSTAIKLAGDLKLERTGEELGRMLVSDPSVGARRRAAVSLGAIGGGEAAARLAPGLADADPGVREATARALAGVDAGPAVPALLRTLQLDPEPRVRFEAVRALATVKSDEARAGIEGAASDGNELVRMEARSVVR